MKNKLISPDFITNVVSHSIDIYKMLKVEKPSPTIPNEDDLILLVGVVDNKITSNGGGSQVFKTIVDAKKLFPELNPTKWSENFTGSQGYQELRYFQYSPYGLEKINAVRFETRIAYNALSY